MRKKAFTVMEIIIVVVIIGILVTLGVPAYKNAIEDSKAKACQANLKALKTGLDIYVMEHDVVPGDLSELSPEHIRKVYVQILKEKGAWKIRLAYLIVGWQQRGLAYAGLLHDLGAGNIASITCPADNTPPAQGGISYALNSVLSGMTSRTYQSLPEDTLLIGDCDITTFAQTSDLAERHRRFRNLGMENYAKVINKGNDILSVTLGSFDYHSQCVQYCNHQKEICKSGCSQGAGYSTCVNYCNNIMQACKQGCY